MNIYIYIYIYIYILEVGVCRGPRPPPAPVRRLTYIKVCRFMSCCSSMELPAIHISYQPQYHSFQISVKTN